MKKPWRYHGECCASGGPAAKTLGACGPSGFGLGTSLGITFTMVPPRFFHRMSQTVSPTSVCDCGLQWLCYCMSVWLCNCVSVCLYGCVTVWLCDCMTVWLYGCMTMWLCDCVTLWLSPPPESVTVVCSHQHQGLARVHSSQDSLQEQGTTQPAGRDRNM